MHVDKVSPLNNPFMPIDLLWSHKILSDFLEWLGLEKNDTQQTNDNG